MELIVREKDYYVHTIKFNNFQIAEINNKFGIWMDSISYCFKTFDNEKDAQIYFDILCEFVNTGRIFDR